MSTDTEGCDETQRRDLQPVSFISSCCICEFKPNTEAPRGRGQAEAGWRRAGSNGDTRHQVLMLNGVRSSHKELGQDATQKQAPPWPPTGDQEHEPTGAPTWKWVGPTLPRHLNASPEITVFLFELENFISTRG